MVSIQRFLNMSQLPLHSQKKSRVPYNQLCSSRLCGQSFRYTNSVVLCTAKPTILMNFFLNETEAETSTFCALSEKYEDEEISDVSIDESQAKK